MVLWLNCLIVQLLKVHKVLIIFCNFVKNKIMTDYIKRISINPQICNGKPIIRGMRITVKTILEYLAAGESPENILKQYPLLEQEDISACLQFGALTADKGIIGFNLVA
jgi:uncharacterized protein (DUF433 family)